MSSSRSYLALTAGLFFLAVQLLDVRPAVSQAAATKPAALQSDASPAPEPAEPQPGANGTVLFSRDLNSTPPAGESGEPAGLRLGDKDPLGVTDGERTALTFTAYDLDLHLTPADHGLAGRAAFTVRNDGAVPLSRLVLQISGGLRWQSISEAHPGGTRERVAYTSRRVATDADHTGWISEAVIPLSGPLAPGASLRLTALYSGAIPQSSERLVRIGAPEAEALAADWDSIDPPGQGSEGTAIALRGFGDVLWYPVSSPPAFLGDGARLFQLAGESKLREQEATVALRLVVEFAGDPPDTAFFCAGAQGFTIVHDNPDAPVAQGTGVATAVFAPHRLGFRPISLFVTDHPANLTGTLADPELLTAVTDHELTLKTWIATAAQVTPLLNLWIGDHPQRPLHLLDHTGTPFADDALLVRSVRQEDPTVLALSLMHSLTHTWIHSSQPWIDEGLAQFMGLLWTEQTRGRQAALAQLDDSTRALALAEPDLEDARHDSPAPGIHMGSSSFIPSGNRDGEPATSATPPGQPLIHASSELFYREKASAVWWMLRSMLGDGPVEEALHQYRNEPSLDRDSAAMEHLLERASHQDLNWFFDDWVYHDRGLPDLAVVNVTSRKIAASNGSGGWLVSVEVRNDGAAVADVPLTLRSAPGASGTAAGSVTQRLRIPGHSSVSRRILFPVAPAELEVNDGSVPETRVAVHVEHLTAPGE